MRETVHITWSPDGGYKEWVRAVALDGFFRGLGPERGMKVLVPRKADIPGSWHLHGAIQVNPKDFVTEKAVAIQRYADRMDASMRERRSQIKTAHASLQAFKRARTKAEAALKELNDGA
jgi:hypothetical protein